MDRSTLLFHWDYVNDSLPPERRDTVGWIVSRVDQPGHVADIGLALDKQFEFWSKVNVHDYLEALLPEDIVHV